MSNLTYMNLFHWTTLLHGTLLLFLLLYRTKASLLERTEQIWNSKLEEYVPKKIWMNPTDKLHPTQMFFDKGMCFVCVSFKYIFSIYVSQSYIYLLYIYMFTNLTYIYLYKLFFLSWGDTLFFFYFFDHKTTTTTTTQQQHNNNNNKTTTTKQQQQQQQKQILFEIMSRHVIEPKQENN